MPLAIIDAAEVAIRFLKNGSQVENVIHVFAPAPLDYGQAGIINAVVQAWIVASLRPLQTNDTISTEIRVAGVNANDPAFVFPGDGFSGSISNSQSPDNVTLSIKKNTGRSGRSYRGRIYHIGININAITNSRVSPGYLTQLVQCYTDLVTNLQVVSHEMVVAHRDRTLPKPWPVTRVEPVLSMTVSDNIVDSQRRRLPGRGR